MHHLRLYTNSAHENPFLGSLEVTIMRVFWECQKPMAIRAVVNELRANGQEFSYSAVNTTLRRLLNKRILDREPTGRYNEYRYIPNYQTEQELNQKYATIVREVLREYSLL